jgi:hypothetical protein
VDPVDPVDRHPVHHHRIKVGVTILMTTSHSRQKSLHFDLKRFDHDA